MAELSTEASGPGFPFVGSFSITNLISLFVTGLFRFSVCSWICLGSLLFLWICPFCLDYLVCQYRIVHSILLQSCFPSIRLKGMSFLSFLILFIWVFSFFVSSAKDLLVLWIFQRTNLWFHWYFSIFFLFSIHFYSNLYCLLSSACFRLSLSVSNFLR